MQPTAAQLRDEANLIDALVWCAKDVTDDALLLNAIGNFLTGRDGLNPDALERLAQRLSRLSDRLALERLDRDDQPSASI